MHDCIIGLWPWPHSEIHQWFNTPLNGKTANKHEHKIKFCYFYKLFLELSLRIFHKEHEFVFTWVFSQCVRGKESLHKTTYIYLFYIFLWTLMNFYELLWIIFISLIIIIVRTKQTRGQSIQSRSDWADRRRPKDQQQRVNEMKKMKWKILY